MANEKKMTKVEMFKALLDKYDLNEKEVEFINHEIKLLEKKNGSRKPTAQQLKNKEVAEKVLAYLKESGKAMQIKQMIKEIPCLAEIPDCTPQYAMAIVRPMKESGLITRTEEKGVAYFSAN